MSHKSWDSDRRPWRCGRAKGAALIESLVSLSISFLILMACLEFLGASRSGFVRLKNAEETRTAACVGLDRMKTDIQEAGRGIMEPVVMGIVDGIRVSDTILTVFSGEEELDLTGDLTAGDTSIPAVVPASLKSGRDICFLGPSGGETHTIQSVGTESILLSEPLSLFFPRQKTRAVVLKRIAFYLDEKTDILRRKVNSSPAQPLVEEVSSFRFGYDRIANRVRIALTVREEAALSALLFPKNLGLAPRQ